MTGNLYDYELVGVNDVRIFTADFTDQLNGDTIANSEWEVTPGMDESDGPLILEPDTSSNYFSATTRSIIVSHVKFGVTYLLVCRVETTDGRFLPKYFTLRGTN